MKIHEHWYFCDLLHIGHISDLRKNRTHILGGVLGKGLYNSEGKIFGGDFIEPKSLTYSIPRFQFWKYLLLS